MSELEHGILTVLSGPVAALGTEQLRTLLAEDEGRLDEAIAALAERGYLFGVGGAWQLTESGEASLR